MIEDIVKSCIMDALESYRKPAGDGYVIGEDNAVALVDEAALKIAETYEREYYGRT